MNDQDEDHTDPLTDKGLEAELEENLNGIELSMNAIDGRICVNTIKLLGQMRNRTILTLLDSGSMHSFVSATTAKALKLDTV